MFHIVDVDNTLVFTNQLNTAGYVYALAQVGLEQTTLNLAMAHLLITQGSEYCALWTAADPERVRLLLNFHNVTDYKAIRFSDKSVGDVVHAIQDFCSLFQCGPEDLCFYDDDPDVIQRLLDYGVSVMAA